MKTRQPADRVEAPGVAAALMNADPAPITVSVTASIGVAIAETSDPLEGVALRRADIAMYHAKHHGGSRYAIYEPGMTMPANEHRRGPRCATCAGSAGA